MGLRVPTRLARATIVLSCAVASLNTAAALVPLSDHVGLDGMGPEYTAMSVIALAVAIAAYVVGCMWLDRSRKFAELMHPSAFRYARGRIWIWIGWFVPVVNLWFPYQVVASIHGAATRRRDDIVLGWWWAWLASYVAPAVSGLYDTAELNFWVGFDVEIDVLTAIGVAAQFVALALWIQIVVESNRAQIRESAVATEAHVPVESGTEEAE